MTQNPSVLSTHIKLVRARDRGTAKSRAAIKHPIKPVSLPVIGVGRRQEAKEEQE